MSSPMKTYEKQTENVLSGSLNLLTPGDLVGQTEAITLDNWRANQDGSLVSRKGRGAAVGTASAAITSITKTETLPANWYIGAGGTLTPLGGGTPVGGFGTDTPISMCAMSGWLWATTRAKRIKHNGSSGYAWVPAAPTAVTATPVEGGGPLVIGLVYTYYVTFVSADGHESGAASVDWIPDNPNQIVRLTLPTSADPQVTGCNIYRIGNTLNDAYLINPAPVTPGSIYEDGGGDSEDYKQSDRSLLLLGITLESNVEDPPAAAGCAGPYFGHLLMWSSVEHPNRLWWSAAWKPWAFPGAAYDAGNWVDVGDEGEEIVDVSLFPRMAIIYKSNSIWRIAGDPDDESASVEQIVGGIGLCGPKARARAGTADYIVTGDGAYRFNGDSTAKASLKLDPIFRGETADTPFALQTMNPARSSTCVAHRYGRVWISYPEDGHTSNNRTIVYDVARDRWVSDSRAFGALFDEGPSGSLLGAVGTQLAGVEDNWTSDNGTAIHLMYQTGYGNQGAAENEKIYADVTIEATTGGADITASLILNNGESSTAVGTLRSTTRTQFVFALGDDDLGIQARNVALRLEGDAPLDKTVTIYSATLHYYVLPRPTLTLDTDFSDWNVPLAKQIDLVELDATFTLPATLSVHVEGSATPSFTTEIPSYSQRSFYRIVVAPAVLGRLVRVSVTSTAPFYPYGGRLRYRPVGEMFDGGNDEGWTMQPSAIGL